MTKKMSCVHVVSIFRRELTNQHESEALRNFFFGYVTQIIVTHEEKKVLCACGKYFLAGTD